MPIIQTLISLSYHLLQDYLSSQLVNYEEHTLNRYKEIIDIIITPWNLSTGIFIRGNTWSYLQEHTLWQLMEFQGSRQLQL